MVLFITIGIGSSLVSRMVLNLRSWSKSSGHYGDDVGWRYNAPSTTNDHELRHIQFASNPPNTSFISMHSNATHPLDPPSKRSQPDQSRPEVNTTPTSKSHHRIRIDTETIVQDDDLYDEVDETNTHREVSSLPFWFSDLKKSRVRGGE